MNKKVLITLVICFIIFIGVFSFIFANFSYDKSQYSDPTDECVNQAKSLIPKTLHFYVNNGKWEILDNWTDGTLIVEKDSWGFVNCAILYRQKDVVINREFLCQQTSRVGGYSYKKEIKDTNNQTIGVNQFIAFFKIVQKTYLVSDVICEDLDIECKIKNSNEYDVNESFIRSCSILSSNF